MDDAHEALLAEVRRRLQETKDAAEVKNSNGSNYWGPWVTRAVDKRAEDGPELVTYVQSVLRKTGTSEGWSALMEADRLDLSFEDMVLNAADPIRELFTDDDRALAAKSLDAQRSEIDQRNAATEATAFAEDQRIVAKVAESRRAAGKPWTDEIENAMLAERAARRRPPR